MELKELKDWFR